MAVNRSCCRARIFCRRASARARAASASAMPFLFSPPSFARAVCSLRAGVRDAGSPNISKWPSIECGAAVKKSTHSSRRRCCVCEECVQCAWRVCVRVLRAVDAQTMTRSRSCAIDVARAGFFCAFSLRGRRSWGVRGVSSHTWALQCTHTAASHHKKKNKATFEYLAEQHTHTQHYTHAHSHTPRADRCAHHHHHRGAPRTHRASCAARRPPTPSNPQ